MTKHTLYTVDNGGNLVERKSPAVFKIPRRKQSEDGEQHFFKIEHPLHFED